MDDEAAAEEAVRNINGTSVKGRNIKVEKSESKGPRKPSQKLFVGNLAEGKLWLKEKSLPIQKRLYWVYIDLSDNENHNFTN